ncbi:putative hydrolase of the HAD superfamily [Haloferula luteola]|uniref:Putative hydrolase of the HAD superfamily n=1 Tax=Haloferula luteola TaxID=595692 RepID=A0A840V3I3_9BACT|nr:putative hydrolase of the HAD superfamily [Haloferula luteola]
MIRALFFDAAGTLIDLAEPVGDVYSRILSKHQIHRTSAELDQAFRRAFACQPAPDFSSSRPGHEVERQWWRDLVETALAQPITEAAFSELFHHYAQPEAWTVFPETPAVLERAHSEGITLAVVSNFDHRLHPILQSLGLADFFHLILSSADARARKPSPLIFRHALQALSLDPCEVIHIGDSLPLDIEAARACGIRAFHVNRPHSTLLDFNWS